eukprot:TRINITY_DN54852_c0_g1_i1.p1 TRINITY_DN54852_c0_g1~~TRINITY_DN54852_c0_g1_i1.p1  ORF type:complete len:1004 (+),score=122.86 TRINITY_DN54852_c0_g1_i1:36-3047(+)
MAGPRPGTTLLLICVLVAICYGEEHIAGKMHIAQRTGGKKAFGLPCHSLDRLNRGADPEVSWLPLYPGQRQKVFCPQACAGLRVTGCGPFSHTTTVCLAAQWLGIPAGEHFELIALPETRAFPGCDVQNNLGAGASTTPALAYTIYGEGVTCTARQSEKFQQCVDDVSASEACVEEWQCGCAEEMFQCMSEYSGCINEDAQSRLLNRWCPRVREIARSCGSFETSCPLCAMCLEGWLSLVAPNGKRFSDTGRLEVYHNGKWGGVCGTNFMNLASSTTACRAMGYAGGTQCTARAGDEAGRCTAPSATGGGFLLEPATCVTGDEPDILSCQGPNRDLVNRWNHLSNECRTRALDPTGNPMVHPLDVGLHCWQCGVVGSWQQDERYTNENRQVDSLMTRPVDSTVISGLDDMLTIFSTAFPLKGTLGHWNGNEFQIDLLDDGGVLGIGTLSEDCNFITFATGERWIRNDNLQLPDLNDLLKSSPEAQGWLDLLELTEMKDFIDVPNNEPLTLFLPTPAAFQRVNAIIGNIEVDDLPELIMRHAIRGRFTANDLLDPDNRKHDTVVPPGSDDVPTTLEFSGRVRTEVKIAVNGMLQVGIVNADNVAANGIIHWIDGVLFEEPPVPVKKACLDREEVDFGEPNALLGVGVVDDECKEILGNFEFDLGAADIKLFPSVADCESVCFGEEGSSEAKPRGVPIPSGSGTTLLVTSNANVKLLGAKLKVGSKCKSPGKGWSTYAVEKKKNTKPKKNLVVPGVSKRSGEFTDPAYEFFRLGNDENLGFGIKFAKKPTALCGGELTISSNREAELKFYTFGSDAKPNFGDWSLIGKSPVYPNEADFGGLDLPSFGSRAILVTSTRKLSVTKVDIQSPTIDSCESLNPAEFLAWTIEDTETEPPKSNRKRLTIKDSGKVKNAIIQSGNLKPDLETNNKASAQQTEFTGKGFALQVADTPTAICGGRIEVKGTSNKPVLAEITLWTTPGRGVNARLRDWEIVGTYDVIVPPADES